MNGSKQIGDLAGRLAEESSPVVEVSGEPMGSDVGQFQAGGGGTFEKVLE